MTSEKPWWDSPKYLIPQDTTNTDKGKWWYPSITDLTPEGRTLNKVKIQEVNRVTREGCDRISLTARIHESEMAKSLPKFDRPISVMKRKFIALETGTLTSGYTMRTIPYFFANKEIFFVLTSIGTYGDWTAFGGKCNEPGKDKQTRHGCAAAELYQESRLLFTPKMYDIYASRINYNLLTYNYFNPRQRKEDFKYEFLQFLPIDEAFALHLRNDYFAPKTMDALPRPEFHDDGNLYGETWETNNIKIISFNELKEHIFSALIYHMTYNVIPLPTLAPFTTSAPSTASAPSTTSASSTASASSMVLKRDPIKKRKKDLLKHCFDASISTGFIIQMIKYIRLTKTSSSMKPYLDQLFTPTFNWHVFNEFYNNHTNFIDDLFGIIFGILESDLHEHHFIPRFMNI